MDEKKLENMQEIEDAQLDEVSGGTRLNTRVFTRSNAAADGVSSRVAPDLDAMRSRVMPDLDAMRSRACAAPDVQSIYAAEKGQPVVVANPDMTLDKSIY